MPTLARLPFDLLLRIALLLPLRNAVLLSSTSKYTRTVLAHQRTFWASLVLHHQRKQPFKISNYEDVSAADLHTLKDIILSSLRLEYSKLDKAPALLSSIRLGDDNDYNLRFVVPGTDLVVVDSEIANTIYCWNWVTKEMLCSLKMPVGVRPWGKRGPCTRYEINGKILFSVYDKIACIFKILQLDYANLLAPVMSLVFEGPSGIQNPLSVSEVVALNIPGFAILVINRGPVYVRIVNLATGEAREEVTTIPYDSTIYHIAPSIIDDHLQIFVVHFEGTVLYISDDTIPIIVLGESLLSRWQEANERKGDEESESSDSQSSVLDSDSESEEGIVMRNISGPIDGAQMLPSLVFPPSQEPYGYLDYHPEAITIDTSTLSSTCIVTGDNDSAPNSVTVLRWSFDPLTAEELLDGRSESMEGPYSPLGRPQHRSFGSFGYHLGVALRLPPGSALLSVHTSSRCRTVVVRIGFHIGQISKFREAYLVRFYGHGGTSVTPLVLPDDVQNTQQITDIMYDESKGTLLLLTEDNTLSAYQY